MNFRCKRRGRGEKNATKLVLRRLQRIFHHVWKKLVLSIFFRWFSIFTLNHPLPYLSDYLNCLFYAMISRSPSPEPIYNSEGKRLNTRDFRVRKKLEEERHTLVQDAMKANPDYKPPADYKLVCLMLV